MKVICSWCESEIKPEDVTRVYDSTSVSHGICPACKDYFFTNKTRTLEGFLNKIHKPVLLINNDARVELANNAALEMLNKKQTQISGFRGGEVMECVYSRRKEGCGNTVHCVACTIRKNVMKTFETGKNLYRVPATLNRLDEHTIDKKMFLISTEKIDDKVLLRIDESL